MEKGIAIRVEHVSKMYKLYDKPSDRLKESLGLTRKKCYREHYALTDVNFEVPKGETIGIIGTNGAGKSTILKIYYRCAESDVRRGDRGRSDFRAARAWRRI